MPLFFLDEMKSPEGVRMIAEDQNDKRIAILVSSEAIDDYGADEARQVASDKYDEGRLQPDGSIQVFTADIDAARRAKRLSR